MKTLYLTILCPLSFLFFSCNNDTSTNPSEERIVVRGYIYANEPVWDIQITHTLQLGSADSTAPPINNAQVTLVKNNINYVLTPSEGDSGYYRYAGNDLVIETGDQVELHVAYEHADITAKTVVPSPPSGITLDKTEIYVPNFFGGFPHDTTAVDPGTGFDRSNSELTVTWDNDPNALFYVVVQNVEENPIEIGTGFRGFGGNGRFVFPPTNQNQYQINAMSLTHYGKHIVRVYRVNQEYADLYGSRTQDSRELNEPLTNIEGGLGIFSAFNSVSATFTVLSSE
jgi:hypothetical protein